MASTELAPNRFFSHSEIIGGERRGLAFTLQPGEGQRQFERRMREMSRSFRVTRSMFND